MSRKLIAIIIFGAVSLFFITKNYIYIWLNSETTDNAYIESDISFISSEVNGVLKNLKVKDNTYVKQGDPLIEIDDKDYQARFMQARAALQIGENAVYNTEYEIKIEELSIQRLKESLNTAKTDLEIANREYIRAQRLEKGKFSSRKLLDDATAALEKAKFDLKKIELDIETAELKVMLLNLVKSTNSISLISLGEELKIAENAYNNTKIIAPVSGIVTNISSKTGSYLRAGSPIFAIVQKENMYIKANFKETQIGKMRPGMSVEITIDSFPNKVLTGKIRNFSPATGSKFSIIPAENASGNFTKVVQRVPTIIDIEIPEDLIIIPGMSVFVRVKL